MDQTESNQQSHKFQPKHRIDKKKRAETTRTLYLATLFPEKPITLQMSYNYHMLLESKRLDVEPMFVECGYFSHRHERDVADPDQILLRQLYLDAVPTDEWILIMDSDEVLLCPPDNIADFLDYLDANDMEVGFVIEERSDGMLRGRPRLIKNKKGLKYGGPDKKHDWIDYNGRNYIAIDNTDTAMDLPLKFYHIKNSEAFVFITPETNKHELKHPDWVYIHEELEEDEVV